MTYTTQGLMTTEDLADQQQQTDTHRHPDCGGHEDAPYEQLSYCTAAQDCPYTDQAVA